MKLRVPELLKERGWTAYELAKRSRGRISTSAAYRLNSGEWRCLSGDMIEALLEVFEISDPGPLFERPAAPRRRRP